VANVPFTAAHRDATAIMAAIIAAIIAARPTPFRPSATTARAYAA
jgi:hypothetical protein